MKDLGVIFDRELNFVQYCKEKINTPYSYLGIIRRNFIYLDEDTFVMLYKSLVKSHLEYANSVWNPHRLGLKISKKFRCVQLNQLLVLRTSLKRLKLPTLKYRRVRGDKIEVYKIFTNKYDSRVNLYTEKQQDSITRGHSLQLVNNRYHYDLRKFSFSPRIANVWNSLTEIVISADTTDTFKNRLDKFWHHHDILYDYKVELNRKRGREQKSDKYG